MSNKNIIWHEHHVSKEERSSIKNQKPCILWFTGLSGSGKSTIANAVEAKLNEMQKHTYLLDGDNIRMGLNKGLGFSDEDRAENIRRIGEVAKLFVDSGLIVLSAFISPFQKERDSVRALVENGEFIEIFIDTPLEVCENRDPKGLYEKVRKGKIADFTGISSPYEAPQKAEIEIQTDTMSIESSVEKIMNYLKRNGYFRGE
ncbi:adenylyl-sulfate kinase [Sulfurimonas sp. SWIR-19]|uniref:adenylyl-sulfate kinase n=1 Tax=Sulfurimonas sp. SWIR-19 TaxID=2878390 RepID=UPI001CF4898A|nr:adenylyl-sulfate kinase [Sulfurimonas sp. SWIR-19]UCN00583.1 adenylyl-sulfate kinase [Sulfurimonas sp. SWIR-19]